MIDDATRILLERTKALLGVVDVHSSLVRDIRDTLVRDIDAALSAAKGWEPIEFAWLGHRHDEEMGEVKWDHNWLWVVTVMTKDKQQLRQLHDLDDGVPDLLSAFRAANEAMTKLRVEVAALEGKT